MKCLIHRIIDIEFRDFFPNAIFPDPSFPGVFLPNDKIPNLGHSISYIVISSVWQGEGELIFMMRNVCQWRGGEAVMNSSQAGMSGSGIFRVGRIFKGVIVY